MINDVSSKNNRILYTLEESIQEANFINNQSEAYEYIMNYITVYGQPKDIKLDIERKKGYVKDMLEKDLLPHVGKNILNKLFYLGYMVNNLLRCYLDIEILMIVIVILIKESSYLNSSGKFIQAVFRKNDKGYEKFCYERVKYMS